MRKMIPSWMPTLGLEGGRMAAGGARTLGQAAGLVAGDAGHGDTAVVMLTLPNTLGLFDSNIAEIRAHKQQIKALERELGRKERALAEAAALLVLEKKARNLFGEPEDGKSSSESAKKPAPTASQSAIRRPMAACMPAVLMSP